MEVCLVDGVFYSPFQLLLIHLDVWNIQFVVSVSQSISFLITILQIKFNSMVNYDWELKYYRGCLIAVSSKCIAYALRGIILT